MIYLVLGSPRSGTSLVAGLLHTNGIKMGDNFPGQSDENPAGYYEDQTLTAMTSTLMGKTRVGGNWRNPPDAEQIAEVKDGVSLVQGWLDSRIQSEDWGAKDPRLCIVWPIVRQALRDRPVKLIACWRNPVSIARSVEKTMAKALHPKILKDTVAVYFQALTEVICTTSFPVLHVVFEDWWHHFDDQVTRVNAFVDRELNYDHFDRQLWRS